MEHVGPQRVENDANADRAYIEGRFLKLGDEVVVTRAHFEANADR